MWISRTDRAELPGIPDPVHPDYRGPPRHLSAGIDYRGSWGPNTKGMEKVDGRTKSVVYNLSTRSMCSICGLPLQSPWRPGPRPHPPQGTSWLLGATRFRNLQTVWQPAWKSPSAHSPRQLGGLSSNNCSW